jgi:hypothetical protein
MDTLLITLISLFSNLISQIQNFPILNQQSLNIFLVTDRKMCFNFFWGDCTLFGCLPRLFPRW